jgi:hypothetical protein
MSEAAGFRAGASSVSIAPPPGLPAVGFVRSQEEITGFGLPLEASALVLESGATRDVLCGVDTLASPSPEVDALRHRVAEAAGAAAAGVLLSWNHTHRAPPASRAFLERSGLLEWDGDERVDAYVGLLHDRVVQAVEVAAARLEPAAIAWGVGEVDLSVNRRERAADGRIVHGWRLGALLDREVVALQAVRPDGTAIATMVGYGCHPVAAGMDVSLFSGDFPAALRAELRRLTGGESVFFQGAAGNVLPMVSFCDDEREAVRMGRRIALEAVHALADRRAWPARLARSSEASLIPMILCRFEPGDDPPTALAAAEERVAFPLLPHPTAEEIAALRDGYARDLAAAIDRGAGPAERHGIAYHAKWARALAGAIEDGTAPTALDGPVHAVRVGDGVIVTAPGEAFTEIGMAVKERAPGRPTLYAAYTNGALGYFPTAEAYEEGGYEPAYSNRSYGAPAPMAAECAGILVERGVRLAESLFPESPPWAGGSWEATGALPGLPGIRLERPEHVDYAPAETARPPG